MNNQIFQLGDANPFKPNRTVGEIRPARTTIVLRDSKDDPPYPLDLFAQPDCLEGLE
jgi:hypothetical protein